MSLTRSRAPLLKFFYRTFSTPSPAMFSKYYFAYHLAISYLLLFTPFHYNHNRVNQRMSQYRNYCACHVLTSFQTFCLRSLPPSHASSYLPPFTIITIASTNACPNIEITVPVMSSPPSKHFASAPCRHLMLFSLYLLSISRQPTLAPI